MPPDPSAPGSLRLALTVLALGIASGILEDLIFAGCSRAIRARNLIYCGLIVVGFIETLGSSYSLDVELVNIRRTIVALGLFGTAVAIGSLFPTPRLPKAILAAARFDHSPRLLWRFTLTAFCLAMLTYAIPSHFSLTAMAHGLAAGRWSAPWSAGTLGGWQSSYQHLEYFGYVLPALTAMIALKQRTWRDKWVLGGLLFTLIFLLFDSQSGGRRGPVAYLGAGGLAWLVGSRKRVAIRHWISICVLVIGVAMFTDFMLKTRNQGRQNSSYRLGSFQSLKVDDNFRLLSYAMQVVPAQHRYVGWRAPYYFLAYPFPRAFWRGKPVDMGLDLAAEVGARSVSYSMTSAGEFYIMFGWPSLLAGGVFFGWLAAWWTQLLEKSDTALGAAMYALGEMALFAGVRSVLVLIEVSYPILVILFLNRYIRREEPV